MKSGARERCRGQGSFRGHGQNYSSFAEAKPGVVECTVMGAKEGGTLQDEEDLFRWLLFR